MQCNPAALHHKRHVTQLRAGAPVVGNGAAKWQGSRAAGPQSWKDRVARGRLVVRGGPEPCGAACRAPSDGLEGRRRSLVSRPERILGPVQRRRRAEKVGGQVQVEQGAEVAAEGGGVGRRGAWRWSRRWHEASERAGCHACGPQGTPHVQDVAVVQPAIRAAVVTSHNEDPRPHARHGLRLPGARQLAAGGKLGPNHCVAVQGEGAVESLFAGAATENNHVAPNGCGRVPGRRGRPYNILAAAPSRLLERLPGERLRARLVHGVQHPGIVTKVASSSTLAGSGRSVEATKDDHPVARNRHSSGRRARSRRWALQIHFGPSKGFCAMRSMRADKGGTSGGAGMP